MSVSIRHIEPNDYLTVESIENAADQLLINRLNPESWEPAPSGRSRAEEPGFVLIAEETQTSTTVGFVHVLESDGIAHLEQLSVLPQYGRRGYGRRLVEAAMDEARRRGYDRLTLRTYADVPWNAPFYARIGFVETEPTTDFHKHLVHVEKRLGLPQYGRRVQMTATLR
ncbi:GNAT family N-acetyltransferase [Agromyces sp. SYSU K20354]|uniref:GNAT family N-acetyltransferase n=1 Tax=Agromyces cavernae TaxID=2898659 RepID=UPI001E60D9D9|nr:GNAT family N-acetyltransferase [Agromyces cavernae]MCD2441829.1 GNAT family N-acetyltransferase [Agromyces cavernae]